MLFLTRKINLHRFFATINIFFMVSNLYPAAQPQTISFGNFKKLPSFFDLQEEWNTFCAIIFFSYLHSIDLLTAKLKSQKPDSISPTDIAAINTNLNQYKKVLAELKKLLLFKNEFIKIDIQDYPSAAEKLKSDINKNNEKIQQYQTIADSIDSTSPLNPKTIELLVKFKKDINDLAGINRELSSYNPIANKIIFLQGNQTLNNFLNQKLIEEQQGNYREINKLINFIKKQITEHQYDIISLSLGGAKYGQGAVPNQIVQPFLEKISHANPDKKILVIALDKNFSDYIADSDFIKADWNKQEDSQEKRLYINKNYPNIDLVTFDTFFPGSSKGFLAFYDSLEKLIMKQLTDGKIFFITYDCNFGPELGLQDLPWLYVNIKDNPAIVHRSNLVYILEGSIIYDQSDGISLKTTYYNMLSRKIELFLYPLLYQNEDKTKSGFNMETFGTSIPDKFKIREPRYIRHGIALVPETINFVIHEKDGVLSTELSGRAQKSDPTQKIISNETEP